MKIAVVTATIGEPRRRAFFTPGVVGHGVEYHCFADRPVRARTPWRFHRVKRTDEPAVMQAKRFKMFAHTYIEADAIVWVDAHLRIICDPAAIFSEFTEPLGLLKHQRHCVYHESRACIAGSKAPKADLQKASVHIRNTLRHPTRWGLWWGGFVMRRITDRSNDLMEAWWNLTCETTPRDQISLPVCLRKSGLRVHTFRRSRREQLFRLMGR